MKATTLATLAALIVSGCGAAGQVGTGTAFGNGGGSAGGIGAVEGNIGATPDGNNGRLSYYGTYLNGTQISDAAFDTNAVGLPNQFFFDASTDYNGRGLKAALYHPTCVTGSTIENYSLILLGDSVSKIGDSDTAVGITVSENTVTYSPRVLKYTNSGDLTKRKAGAAPSVVATSCITGKRTVPGLGTLYSNGQLAIFRTVTGNVYLGFNSSLVAGSVPNAPSENYNQYVQSFHPDCKLDGCFNKSGSATSFASMEMGISPNSLNSSVTGTGVMFGMPPGAGNADPWKFNSIKYSSSVSDATICFVGVVASIGGKRIVVASLPFGTMNDSNDSTSTKASGANTILLRLQD